MNKVLSALIEEIKLEAAKPTEELQLARLRSLVEFGLRAQDIDIDTAVQSCYVDSPGGRFGAAGQLPARPALRVPYGPPAAERLSHDLTDALARMSAPKPETLDSLITAYNAFAKGEPLDLEMANKIKKLIEIKVKELEEKYENLHPQLPGGRSAAE
jgi:hypothetical protein